MKMGKGGRGKSEKFELLVRGWYLPGANRGSSSWCRRGRSRWVAQPWQIGALPRCTSRSFRCPTGHWEFTTRRANRRHFQSDGSLKSSESWTSRERMRDLKKNQPADPPEIHFRAEKETRFLAPDFAALQLLLQFPTFFHSFYLLQKNFLLKNRLSSS